MLSAEAPLPFELGRRSIGADSVTHFVRFSPLYCAFVIVYGLMPKQLASQRLAATWVPTTMTFS